MSGPERDDAMREMVREVLRELVPGMLRGEVASGGPHRAGVPEPGDDQAVAPRVPALPVAAVLRPSTWDRPAAPGEIIGRSTPAPAPVTAVVTSTSREDPPPVVPGPSQPVIPEPGSAPEKRSSDARVDVVAIDTDEDLEGFVTHLLSRLENPRERRAIRTGRLRFALRHSPASAASRASDGRGSRAPVTRVEKGAVTERAIHAAAEAGTRLVLAPGAVLTPLARDQAKARGVEIERERRC
ncbi:MAG: hypothetical protein M3022_10105 [Actinomycetota bacterium]|nr:hypothetical protein [Actinomycetota bacterium]